MRCVVQRVSEASVAVDGQEVGRIGVGLVALLGVTHGDGPDEAGWMAERLATLRVFADERGRMNRSVLDVGGAVLAVPNFTLYADCTKGRRPGFDAAAPPEVAEALFGRTCDELAQRVPLECGVFGAHMHVSLTNDGPVTLVLERVRLAQQDEHGE